MITYLERIITDHKIMLGKPVIKGTRITVELILKKLSQGATQQEVTKMYPELNLEDVNAALAFALLNLKGEDSFGFAA
ncbi:MAG: DUF433 domain-containing protein [Opitutaceae bacterium]|nr:DUF433 domain-containing protein [Cytophagales bacterium]